MMNDKLSLLLNRKGLNVMAGNGAFVTGKYPNVFEEIGISKDEVLEKIRKSFDTIFFDPEENFFHEVDSDSACMVDTGNIDARTEGMSYGMMMCVQMDRQDLFNKLWTFSVRYMRQTSGIYEGYFAWSTQLNGEKNAQGPAPDGEEYFAMALFMAGDRWGDGEGIFNYTAEAREILRHCVHQSEIVPGGEPMWDPDNHYIKFTPEAKFTDPSYHLPHFYELFALKVNEEDRPFWKKAAEASREFIALSADPVTGMSAEYTEYSGATRLMFRKPWAYYSDAYRVAENIALDRIWFGPTAALEEVETRLQDTFAKYDLNDLRAYDLDGTPAEEPAMHPVAIISVLGAASAASHSEYRRYFLEAFWNTPLRTGKRRYYDNCLYFFCLMMLGGEYKVW